MKNNIKIDPLSDEVKLSSSLIERLEGKFRFLENDIAIGSNGALVDVAATNGNIILNDTSLDGYQTIPPGDSLVERFETLQEKNISLTPEKLCIVFLAGGMSFRTGGRVHPLLTIGEDNSVSQTLLRRQLDRVYNSPLGNASVCVVGTPFNHDVLYKEIQKVPKERLPRLYIGGLIPRLSPYQKLDCNPLIYKDHSGRISYNPIGHFEAFRWFVLSGMLADLAQCSIILLTSYSNWGNIFTGQSLNIAGYTDDYAATNSDFVFLAELVKRLQKRRPGSILVTRKGADDCLRLIKYNYGLGNLNFQHKHNMLLSTNTLYISIKNILKRLTTVYIKANHLTKYMKGDEQKIKDAIFQLSKQKLSDLFDFAFPIAPQLIATPSQDNAEFLRIERDLDQLSFLPGKNVLKAVEVNNDRYISIKLESDFKDPLKRKYLYGLA